MAHDIGLDVRRPDEENLAAGWVTVAVLNARERLRRVPGAIENHFRILAHKRHLNVFNLSSDETDFVLVSQPTVEILHMLRGVHSECSE